MYLTYFAFAILIAVAEIVKTSNKGQDDYKPFHITTQVIYWLWFVMNIVISSSIWVGRRHSIAWTGLYTTLSYGVFIAGTLAPFHYSFTIPDFPIEYVVLILMACTVFILERIIEPRDRQVSKRKRQVTFTLYPSIGPEARYRSETKIIMAGSDLPHIEKSQSLNKSNNAQIILVFSS